MAEKSRTGETPESVQPQGASAPAGVDQVRPLADLAKDAQALDAGSTPGAALPVPAQATGPDPAAKDVADILRGVREAADPLVAMLGYFDEGQICAVWTDDALLKIAEPLVAIMRRHGWSGDVGKLGPYIALALAAGPPIAGTAVLYRLNAKARSGAPRVDHQQQEGAQGGQQQPA